MNEFKALLEKLGLTEDCDNNKYCKAGKTFKFDNEYIVGNYWYYESESFIINIHDFYIKKDTIIENNHRFGEIVFFSSSYLKCANGECISPYQNLSSNIVFVNDAKDYNLKFLLHGNFPYSSVGINFKENLLKEYLPLNDQHKLLNIFFDTRKLIVNPLAKLSESIINCTMAEPAAKIFFEAKAKEWLSITLDAYFNQNTTTISKNDELALDSVINYINDHFSLNIPQQILEQISTMSGTKLKKLFKQRYHMSITEYTQRKRMNIAENLITTASLNIKDIAKSVGYTSHSRFSILFKKYKGISPKDMLKITNKNKED